MYVIERLVWLFWTSAELAILLLVRQWLIRLEGIPRRQRFAVILASLFMAVLVFINFSWQALLGPLLEAHSPQAVMLFDFALWDFGAMLWVMIEAVILVYIVRLYGLLRGQSPGKTGLRAFHAAAGLLVFLCCAGYAGFVFELVLVAHRYGLNDQEIQILSTFYLKVCGVVWILVEGAYAVYAVRAWRLFAKAG